MRESESTMEETKATMSVRTMRDLLGLGKTESYWLIKKGYFETTVFDKKLRVCVDSFEEWYDNQSRYRKVNGPAPVSARDSTMTVAEMSKELGISCSTARSLVRDRKLIKYRIANGLMIIDRADYERWYRSQFSYHKTLGEPPGQAYPASMSAHEMCDLLGIPLNNTGYALIRRHLFDSFMVDGQHRIDTASFERWYRKQSHYKKVERSE